MSWGSQIPSRRAASGAVAPGESLYSLSPCSSECSLPWSLPAREQPSPRFHSSPCGVPPLLTHTL